MERISSNKTDIHIVYRCVFYLKTRKLLGSERILNSSDIGYCFTEFPYMTASTRYCFFGGFLKAFINKSVFLQVNVLTSSNNYCN